MEIQEDANIQENLDINSNPNFYISVSPKIFRKNIYQLNKLQREIFIRKNSGKLIDFDPNYVRKAPLYLDIPNLYRRKIKETPKSSNKKKDQKRYKYIAKMVSKDQSHDAPRYKYIPRPETSPKGGVL